MDHERETPLLAIQAFESLTGLSVTIHDYLGLLTSTLETSRTRHVTPFCVAVKAVQAEACVAFDTTRTHEVLRQVPGGSVKTCHAGFVEWVVPFIRHSRIEWVLFAGQRTPGRSLMGGYHHTTSLHSSLAEGLQLPTEVEEEASQHLLESLRQLNARLKDWVEEQERSPAYLAARPLDSDSENRKEAIWRFIEYRHRSPTRLRELAEYLHISESRAGHAVREACGQSFIELLSERRLRTAASLLSHSNLSVQEVAMRSGFGDPSNFHHAFRKRYGLTPYQYRRAEQSAASGTFPI